MSGEGRGFVIDTNVIVGAFFYGSDYPQLRTRERILENCRLVLHHLRGRNVAIPWVGVVEVISVVKRITGDRGFAIRMGKAVENSFETVPENELYEIAKELASTLAPSGFDTYFLALSLARGYSLITRDTALCNHAQKMGVECLFIDESVDEKRITEFVGV